MQHSNAGKGGAAKDHEDATATEGTHRQPVGLPLMHRSALPQVCGEAKYTDDIAEPRGCLHAALVMSVKAHAKVLSVDPSLALDESNGLGVVRFFSHEDIPQNGSNKIGAIFKDEECLVTSVVTAVGQPLGLIVADSAKHAEEAAKLVKVTYEDCLLYTSPSPRDRTRARMPSSA